MAPAALCLTAGLAASPSAPPSEIHSYLRTLAKDTWTSIDSFVEPSTGLPFDDTGRGEYTSVSNIGIYLTSVCGAKLLGFISPKEAERRASKTLDSVEKLQTWFGFQQTWNSVKTLKPASHDPWISVLDSGNLCAGLLAVAGTLPGSAKRSKALFLRHEWRAFYDKDTGFLTGGYNAATKEFNRKWRLDALGTDAALSQIMAISVRQAPKEMWGRLNRRAISWEGESFLWPGWDGGGLFMQHISGMWADLSGTELGISGQSFARAQIRHGKTLGSPVWGWSASAAPDGSYLGWGVLKEEVVTPHASVLVVETQTEEVVKNLKALEALGARSSTAGFYDSVNWKTGAVSKKQLLLDQGMIFISIVNRFTGGGIRKAVAGSGVNLRPPS